jgi:hypothetical protein
MKLTAMRPKITETNLAEKRQSVWNSLLILCTKRKPLSH